MPLPPGTTALFYAAVHGLHSIVKFAAIEPPQDHDVHSHSFDVDTIA
jgi:hypothetical protein